jgi:prepilin-type N-terminal cleavage/methylation domain-containing protein
MSRSPFRSRSRAGFTFIELAIVLVVLLSALLVFSSTVSGMAKQRTSNRETYLAVEAAKNRMETLRATAFDDVYSLYNRNPADDPGAAGTAPGARFDVPGLDHLPDVGDELEGEVVFPELEDPPGTFALREDVTDAALGLPRDLSGDNRVDAVDHSGSYLLLPVEVRIRWRSPNGPREYALRSQLCRWVKE